MLHTNMRNQDTRVQNGQTTATTNGGMRAEYVNITPGVAEQLLATNQSNRKIRKPTVRRYAALMRKGSWLPNNDTICVDENDSLLNGQHRLLAVIEADEPQVFLVQYGVPEESFQAMDNGARRSLHDHLHLLGFENEKILAAVAKRLAFFAKADRLTSSMARFGSNSQAGSPGYADVDDQIQVALDYEPARVSAEFGSRHAKTPFYAASHIGFIHALYAPWHDGVENFMERTFTGLGLSEGDPAYALRRRLENNLALPSYKQWPRGVSIGYAIMALNADAEGRDIFHSEVQWKKKDVFPQPLVSVAPLVRSALGWPDPTLEFEEDE